MQYYVCYEFLMLLSQITEFFMLEKINNFIKNNNESQIFFTDIINNTGRCQLVVDKNKSNKQINSN